MPVNTGITLGGVAGKGVVVRIEVVLGLLAVLRLAAQNLVLARLELKTRQSLLVGVARDGLLGEEALVDLLEDGLQRRQAPNDHSHINLSTISISNGS